MSTDHVAIYSTGPATACLIEPADGGAGEAHVCVLLGESIEIRLPPAVAWELGYALLDSAPHAHRQWISRAARHVGEVAAEQDSVTPPTDSGSAKTSEEA